VRGLTPLSRVHLLVANNLVDEYRLIYPFVLGGGKRLFPDGIEAASLKLVESQPVGGQGVLTAVYQPA
jgi:dihydrofolate reductase